jgi:hypothetical protein
MVIVSPESRMFLSRMFLDFLHPRIYSLLQKRELRGRNNPQSIVSLSLPKDKKLTL